jgi:hypothetical protein
VTARKNIYAFTEPSGSYPAYVSVNAETDGLISITVRGPAVDGREGPTTSISLTEDQANTMADDILDHTIAAEMRRERALAYIAKGETP